MSILFGYKRIHSQFSEGVLCGYSHFILSSGIVTKDEYIGSVDKPVRSEKFPSTPGLGKAVRLIIQAHEDELANVPDRIGDKVSDNSYEFFWFDRKMIVVFEGRDGETEAHYRRVLGVYNEIARCVKRYAGYVGISEFDH